MRTTRILIELLFWSTTVALLCSALASIAAGAVITRNVITTGNEVSGTVRIDTFIGRIVWSDLSVNGWMPGHVTGAGSTTFNLDSTRQTWLPATDVFVPAPAMIYLSPQYTYGAYTSRVALVFDQQALGYVRDYYSFSNVFAGDLHGAADYPLHLTFQSFIYGRSPFDVSSPHHIAGGLSIVPEADNSAMVLIAAACVTLFLVVTRFVGTTSRKNRVK